MGRGQCVGVGAFVHLESAGFGRVDVVEQIQVKLN